MGDYTKFVISIHDKSAEYNEDPYLIIREITSDANLSTYIANTLCASVFTNDSVKWYEHEEDVKFVSKKYPHLVIRLIGLKDSSSESFVKYFDNGVVTRHSLFEFIPTGIYK